VVAGASKTIGKKATPKAKQKAKQKSRGSIKEQAERRKARDETCLALLKEKWPKQYAQMLSLVGEAIEKATCKGSCKRTLDWRFFISL
jgi:hypothetical protein